MIKDSEFALRLLEEYSMADRDQIEAAREAALESGSNDAVAELVNSGIVDYHEMLDMLAQQYGMEVTSIAGYDIPPEVIAAVKVEYARYYQIIPVSIEDTLLTVAMSDPTDVEKLDTLRKEADMEVEAELSKIKKEQENYLLKLDENFEENCEKYADEIFKRIIAV